MEPVTSKTMAEVAPPCGESSAVPGSPTTAAVAAETASSSRRSGARGLMLSAVEGARGCRVEARGSGSATALVRPAATRRALQPAPRSVARGGARGTCVCGGVPLLGARGGS